MAYSDGTSGPARLSVSDLTRAVRVLAGLLFLLGTGCSDTVDQTPEGPPAEEPPPEEPPAEEPPPSAPYSGILNPQ